MKSNLRKLKRGRPNANITRSQIRSPGRYSLAHYLKKQRIEAGLTQADLARILNYSSAQFISNWERGLSQPPHKAITKIAKLLKLDIKTVIRHYSAHTEFLLRAHLKGTAYDSPVEPQAPEIGPLNYPKASGE